MAPRHYIPAPSRSRTSRPSSGHFKPASAYPRPFSSSPGPVPVCLVAVAVLTSENGRLEDLVTFEFERGTRPARRFFRECRE
jgi:hypothetical protein